ncbi:hypothetical protein A2U94_10200 [Bacillus sp. VT 712]|uniref:Uncharacterized protein n=1 Tax=Priestia veravalensis TaxID=1414648 RepID=A0A0V8JQ06_9BACI|nr:hypothetical protein AS180_05035 [Priestia veravalensis]KZB91483.1 hypothetical protein A2U94_10200 [Bacillus sp. VT 712]
MTRKNQGRKDSVNWTVELLKKLIKVQLFYNSRGIFLLILRSMDWYAFLFRNGVLMQFVFFL